MKIYTREDKVVIADFSEVEALRVALKLENDGIKFYLKAAQIAKEPEIKDVFKKLAAEEQKHVEVFQKYLQKIINEKKLEMEVEPGYEESFFDYVETGVFADLMDMEKTLGRMKCASDVVNFAEGVEMASINFYKAMFDKTENAAGKANLKNIIEEEQKHLKTFMRYAELIKKKEKK
ncbi:MAG: ferritin family protein [Candidatus Saganbacteria bacterium]|nr:ferritin family protein [Candidatus Saganbacteria bacterium]